MAYITATLPKKVDTGTMDEKSAQDIHHQQAQKPTRKALRKGEQSIFKVREGLKTHFKILYIAMVFTGMALVWYGIWKGVQSMPIISNPIVAIAIGLVLLGLTGRVNKLE